MFCVCITNQIQLTTTTSSDQPLVLLTSENLKNNREHTELFNNLVSEYDRRLEEQVKLAKQDMLNELEVQIQVSQVEHDSMQRISDIFHVLDFCCWNYQMPNISYERTNSKSLKSLRQTSLHVNMKIA